MDFVLLTERFAQDMSPSNGGWVGGRLRSSEAGRELRNRASSEILHDIIGYLEQSAEAKTCLAWVEGKEKFPSGRWAWCNVLYDIKRRLELRLEQSIIAKAKTPAQKKKAEEQVAKMEHPGPTEVDVKKCDLGQFVIWAKVYIAEHPVSLAA